MLFLYSKQEEFIRIDAQTVYPNECCGVLIGEINDSGVKTVKHVQTIRNSREDEEQYHRFLITPQDMLQVEQAARVMKLDVIGFYHSHPDHPSAPSGYDKDHALPFYSYVIVSVKQGKAKELTSWELTADRAGFVPETILKEDQQ